MTRISTGIFQTDNYLIKYDRVSEYINCTCGVFVDSGKCEHTLSVMKTLEAEGFHVKHRRIPKPTFIEEIEPFTARCEEILNECKNHFQSIQKRSTDLSRHEAFPGKV